MSFMGIPPIALTGAVFGAFLSGVFYRMSKGKLFMAVLGEIIGTGCTFSSAIASNLAKGMSLTDAISAAKEYISASLASGLDLGKGSGPLNHGVTFLP